MSKKINFKSDISHVQLQELSVIMGLNFLEILKNRLDGQIEWSIQNNPKKVNYWKNKRKKIEPVIQLVKTLDI